MNNSILHISDLHFVGKSHRSRTRYTETYQEIFINTLLKLPNKIKYVVVTGDIADKAQEIQYKNALQFLNALVSRLDVKKKNVLLCPGNHDIDWDILNEIIKKEDIEESTLNQTYLRSEKYNNFKNFYTDFYGDLKKFDNDLAIFDKIIDKDDKIIILGVNTCYKESNQDYDHIGYINQELFERELRQIKMKENFNEFGKILAMHHNPKDLGEDKKHHLENWKDLNKDLIGYPFIVLCGHIHGADGEGTIRDDENTIFYISTGSLLKSNIDNTFNIYNNLQNDSFTILYYALVDKTNPGKYIWQHISEKNAVSEPKYRPTKTDKSVTPDKFNTLLENISEIDRQDLDRKLNKPNTLKAKPTLNKIDKSIMAFIKERSLFKSGHFHWKNDFRSHGFIDINNLVSNKDSLELLTKLYYNEIIAKFEGRLENAIIIAVGIECNIIGARLSALLDCGYSYIPEPNKTNDFSEIEKKINSEDYKNIILLKDIVFTAEHSKELLTSIKIENKYVFIFSLFYCGKKELKQGIFSDYDNVKFTSICDEIEINQCDYSGKGRLDKCPIYIHKLETIYDEC